MQIGPELYELEECNFIKIVITKTSTIIVCETLEDIEACKIAIQYYEEGRELDYFYELA